MATIILKLAPPKADSPYATLSPQEYLRSRPVHKAVERKLGYVMNHDDIVRIRFFPSPQSLGLNGDRDAFTTITNLGFEPRENDCHFAIRFLEEYAGPSGPA